MLYFVITNEYPFEGETTLKLLQNILNPKLETQFTRKNNIFNIIILFNYIYSNTLKILKI